MNQNYWNKIKGAIGIVAYIAFVLVIWYYISAVLVEQNAVRHFISQSGVFAPIVFILIQITQNIIAPIAHYPILLAGGYIFGPWLGFLYNWIGTSIGTILIILIAKKFGRPLVRKMVNEKFIQRYDGVIQKLSPFGLFLIYALPIFPDDEITYLIGVSAMPIKSVLVAVILGKMPGAGLSFMGDKIFAGMEMSVLIQIGVGVLIIGILWYLRKNIMRLFKRKPKISGVDDITEARPW